MKSLRRYSRSKNLFNKVKCSTSLNLKRRFSKTKLRNLLKRLRKNRRFGSSAFPNSVAAPYFGSNEPFNNASEWWYPVSNGKYQSPEMLRNF